MKLQAVDSQSFQSKRDRDIRYNNDGRNPRHNIDKIISLDDGAIRQIAYAKTMASVEDKKHRKIVNAMFYSIPLVAGIATAVLNPGKSSLLTKELSGFSGRLMNGAKSTASWAVIIGLVEAMRGSRNFVENKSPEIKKANRENPFLAFVGTAAAFLGVAALGGKYLPKLAEKGLKHVKPESIARFENKIVDMGKSLNNKGWVKSLRTQVHKANDSRVLSPLKTVGEFALSWAPSLLLWGGVFHSINHSFVKNREFVNNYSDIKEAQTNLSKARLSELSRQNNELKAGLVECATANLKKDEGLVHEKANCPECVEAVAEATTETKAEA